MPHFDAADCVLVVIDAQDGFYGPDRTDVDRAALTGVLHRAAWVAGVATGLGIPAVVTEEDPATNGPTAPAVRAALAPDSPVFPKAVFGANDNPAIAAAVEASGRGIVVLVGLETDVCVAHSALGWHHEGRRVVVVRDAVFSPSEAHHFGLARLAEEGVELVSAKEAYYEWLPSLAAARAFRLGHPHLARPPGFSL